LKKTTLILCILFLINSCKESKIDGYNLINDGVHLKLYSFEDSVKTYQKGDFIKATFFVYDEDTVKYLNYKYIPFLPTTKSFDNIFTLLNVGDSAELLVSKLIFDDNSFGFSSKEFNADWVKINVKIEDFLKEKEYDNFLKQKDNELLEQLILKSYLSTEDKIEKVDNIYYVKLKETSNKTIKNADIIDIRYTGGFISGVVFDTTFSKEPFELVYGTPNQVIEGLDRVLKVLKNGEKAKIIIPSQFAFGDKGSSTGIVPPYSTVIYNLEIINIK
jgi:FKBP-type peptidyl-prolyl cis-trans isomerase FkpA